jgi:hypothetical protein
MPDPNVPNARGVRPLMVAALIVSLAACERSTPAHGGRARDADDSVAFASLPPTLARELSVRAVLTPDALRDTTRVACEALGAPDTVDVRRRLRAVLPDSARTVLFARARRIGGELQRVELVRRAPSGAQRGFIWDAGDDAVRSVVWARGGAAAPEVTTLPRGGPLPAAMRALGTRLHALPCPRRAPNTPPG